MVVEPQEATEPPSNQKKSKWDKIKSELLFWTTLTANLITIFFFLYKLIKNGN